ncbi:DUF2231 domain-containing protein [Micromonospora soli]|uniref:DUF2231 domain-containing protein n=1 Tax=Micromonospora sp. NBRC 110009 TaxID=3061627 RepID=UPI002671B05B|nr:DUF2231 domain-containing protein [Micromonospora sp. NBRC 110009]WKT97664.1 DUF2231 domain-containing protein [Micromonospora sp. NBRC 110009]
MDRAKHPVSNLAGRYGHPLHPALVAVPIGAWVASFAFDLASRFVSEPQALAEGARWLIGLGVIGALAAALVGFLDLFAIPTGTPVFRTALAHMAINLAVTGAYAVNFAVRGAGTAGPVAAGPLALSAVSLAGLTVAGYLGGELAYRYGVRVADETTQAPGYRSTDKENS